MQKLNYLLYLVTNREILGDRKLIDAVRESIEGGVSIVQLREKNISYNEFLSLALELKMLTDSYNIPLIINDNIQIAKEIDASGVHIGQSDDTIQSARALLGEHKIIGVSVGNVQEAKNAQSSGANYVGIGAVFDTKSKADINAPLGLKQLKEIAVNINIPSVAIGGINALNVKEIMQCEVSGVAVISAILGKQDCKSAALNLINIIKGKNNEQYR